MENVLKFKPLILTVILDLSNRHVQEVKNSLEPFIAKLEVDDLYLNNGEFIAGNFAMKSFFNSPIEMSNLGLGILQAVRFLNYKTGYRKKIIVAVDRYEVNCNFDISSSFNLCKNTKDDLDFYFLKIGKENLDFEKIVISYPRSSYFKNINDLIQKLQKD